MSGDGQQNPDGNRPALEGFSLLTGLPMVSEFTVKSNDCALFYIYKSYALVWHLHEN